MKYDKAVLDAVLYQIEFREPFFVYQAYEELTNKGYSNSEATYLIAETLSDYIIYLLSEDNVYNEIEYQNRIKKLSEVKGKDD